MPGEALCRPGEAWCGLNQALLALVGSGGPFSSAVINDVKLFTCKSICGMIFCQLNEHCVVANAFTSFLDWLQNQSVPNEYISSIYCKISVNYLLLSALVSVHGKCIYFFSRLVAKSISFL